MKTTWIKDEFIFQWSAAGMGRIGALDIGTKKVGIAVSDCSASVSTGLGSFMLNECSRRNGSKLTTLVSHYPFLREIKFWVSGMPINLDGTQGHRTDETLSILHRIAKRGILKPEFVLLQDERFSTMLARGDYNDNIQPRDLDALSASRILSEFLLYKQYKKLV